MQKNENTSEIYINILVILLAFVWIGYAYFAGTKTEQLVLHPIVPFLLIALLLRFRKHESTRAIINIAFIFIGIWIFIRLQNVFMPFIIGFSLAYIVNVALAGLQDIPLPKGKRLRLPKWASILIFLFLVISIITFLALGIFPQVVQQISDMQDGMSKFYESIKEYTITVTEDISIGDYPFKDSLPESWQEPIGEYFDSFMSNLQTKIPSIASAISQVINSILHRLSSGFIGTVGKISSAFFIFVVFVYAIQSFRSHIEKVLNLFPESQKGKISEYLKEIDHDMRSFLKGQLAVIIIISIISITVYSIIRVPFALLVGLLAGLCNAIPTVGPILGGAIACLASITGFAAGNFGLAGFLIQLLLIIVASFAIQLIDNSFISPKIMSKAVEVHPLIVMFAVLLSASLIGIWGAILTIPVVVIIKVIIDVSKKQTKNSKADE